MGDAFLIAASGFLLGFLRGVAGLVLALVLYCLFYLAIAIDLDTARARASTGELSIRAISCSGLFHRIYHLKRRRTCSMSIFKNRTVIGVICILLALVICFGITPLFNQGISQKAEIVRVTKDIHAGELITKDMVTTAEVGSYNLPSGLMTAKNNVVGKYAKADLAVGDYILAAKLSEAPAAENAYLYNLDGTKQAISVTIKSFATGLSGKLQSGDIVSVIVADYPEDGETTIPAELQYVEIISVTASTGYDANTGEAKSDEKELPSTVTFLVPAGAGQGAGGAGAGRQAPFGSRLPRHGGRRKAVYRSAGRTH